LLWTVAFGVQVLLAGAVLIDRHLHGGHRSTGVLAILVLVLVGAVAYADNIISAIHQAGANPRTIHMTVTPEDPGQTPVLTWIYTGGSLLLASVGALSAVLRRKE
jgi:hypothetical protein